GGEEARFIFATPCLQSGHCWEMVGKRGARAVPSEFKYVARSSHPAGVLLTAPFPSLRTFRHSPVVSTCRRRTYRAWSPSRRGVSETLDQPSACPATLAASTKRRFLPADHRHDRRSRRRNWGALSGRWGRGG